MKNAVARRVTKLGLLAAMTVIAASVSASAQSLQYRLTANIPFDFSVAGTKLQAGKYWINRSQQGSGDMVVQISSPDGHSNVTRLTIPVSVFNPVTKSTLVFHRYGDQYFLSEVWPAGAATGREFPKTRAERELARQAQDSGVAAVNTPDVKTITITVN
jgi:hypothetical protein